MKINELNFKNLTIKYDGDKFSKSKIVKIKIIEALGVIATLILFFGVIIVASIFLDAENNFGSSLFIVLLLETASILGGVFGTTALVKRVAPKRYEFISWLVKFKKDEIEIGWLNNRYVVQIDSQNRHMEEFGRFITEDYYLNDGSDKSKPIHMVIDLTKEDVEVVVENK